MKKLIILCAVFYGGGIYSSARDDYTRFGMTAATSILWGAFWGPRALCQGTNWQCSILPWGVFPDGWILNMRPEIIQEIEANKQHSGGI